MPGMPRRTGTRDLQHVNGSGYSFCTSFLIAGLMELAASS